MNDDVGKTKMKASESAPMPTKQKDDGKVRNQTTEVPRNSVSVDHDNRGPGAHNLHRPGYRNTANGKFINLYTE